MLKEFAWKAFEKTGDVGFYMFYREVDLINTGFHEEARADGGVAANNSVPASVPV